MLGMMLASPAGIHWAVLFAVRQGRRSRTVPDGGAGSRGTVIRTWYRLSRFSRRWRSSSHRKIGHGGVNLNHDPVPRQAWMISLDFSKDLVADGLLGLEISFALAVKARLAENAGEALLGSFPGHLDEPEVRHLQDVGLAFVPF